MVIFDTADEAQTRGAYDVCRRLVREAAKLGYGEYRAHLDFMDLAAEQYSFGDHAYRRFCETIKDALDPQRDPLARQAGDLAAVDARRPLSPLPVPYKRPTPARRRPRQRGHQLTGSRQPRRVVGVDLDHRVAAGGRVHPPLHAPA